MAPSPLVVKGFLIVRGDGSHRTVTKRPHRLRLDEVAFPLTVTIPRSWGQVQPTSIDIDMPEPPDPRVTIGEPEMDE